MKKQTKKTEKRSENEPIIYCRYTEIRDISELKENPRNPNKHPQFQLERLAEVIKGNGWRQPVTVSDLSGLIVKGHGRLQAAKLAGLKKIPVEVQHYETEADEMADLLADNKIAELAELDEAAVLEILDDMKEQGLPVELAGYTEEDLEELLKDPSEAMSEEKYTSLLKPITYEPKGERPALSEIVNRDKTNELLAEIESATGISDEEKQFLIAAAQRHYTFFYDKAAEYYAQASPEMQRLMESSALVIIDYDSAIENGYVNARCQMLQARRSDGIKEHQEGDDDETED